MFTLQHDNDKQTLTKDSVCVSLSCFSVGIHDTIISVYQVVVLVYMTLSLVFVML